MKLVNVGAAVLNQTPLAWDANRDRILAAIEAARAAQVSLLCLPELCISGYGCEDAFLGVGVQRMAWDVLREILPATNGLAVAVGLPVLHNNALYNAAALVADGRILGLVAKRYLAGDGLHYEPRWFKPWPAGRQAELVVDGQAYPLGDIHFNLGGVKVGFEICEDAWVASRPGTELALKGCDIILNPSASHFAFDKDDVRQRFVLEGSRAFGVSYVYANLLGNEAGRAIYDGGALIASAGRMLALGPRFSFADFRLTNAQIDIDATRMNQARTASFRPQFDEDPSDCIAHSLDLPVRTLQPVEAGQAAWESSPRIKEEEFTRALSLGLFDYLRKSRSGGFVVSLSGGADSAAVTCLVGTMVDLGVRELGWEAFAASTGCLEGVNAFAAFGQDQQCEALVRRLLTCVYQATRNSSQVTREAARAVATGVGAEFLELDVDGLVQTYVGLVSQAIERPLTWERDDIALQNIQARVRAPSVWLLANLRGALLLATSNRSEAAVGYATMDGDTCGGLSPLAGIDKNFLRRWLRWRETKGPEGLGPLAALAAVTQQGATAELRPPAAGQTDEADLMPYDILDFVERAAIRDKQAPLEVWQRLCAGELKHTPAQLAIWVERFFRLWCRNQWKRERYAPSFHVDDANLDPKTWCRFPILSGGYERELAALRTAVAQLKAI